MTGVPAVGGVAGAGTAPSRIAPAPRGAFRRLVARPVGAVAVAVLAVVVVGLVAAPLLVRYAPDTVAPAIRFQPPSGAHWFGTDELGRDLFSRVLYGGRLTVGIAFGSTVVAMVVGVVWGFVAAQVGGWLDEVLMRFVDVLMAIPIILFALILVAAFGSGLVTLSIVIGLLMTPATARLARAAVLTELRSDYYRAAVAVGVSRMRALFGEVLPNTMSVLVARAAIVAADAIVIEASLSFIGLGVRPPAASWGTLLRQGYDALFLALWYVAAPAIAIFALIWALNMVGDRLQDVLDPRLQP